LLGNGLTSYLIGQLGLASLTTPAVSGLLLVFSNTGPAVAVSSKETAATTATTATAPSATTTALSGGTITRRIIGVIASSPDTVLVGSYTAVAESIVVRVAGIAVTRA